MSRARSRSSISYPRYSIIATDLRSGETSTTGLKVPFGRSLGSGGLTLMTTLKLFEVE